MSVEKVRAYLTRFGAEDRIRTFDVSSATVALAAAALGVGEARIAKTMAFSVDGAPVLVVAAGDRRVDNQKFKAAFSAKAKMLPPEQLETAVGYPMGGVCPFAVNDGCRVYLDASLRRFDVVYPAAGSADSAVELTVPELERFSGFEAWVDVCKE
ncbi:MAG: YbaK/EbsC family protein [Clostridia bacterium]|nr:YbaK/EbsC family protein [Clostridia bacterium]